MIIKTIKPDGSTNEYKVPDIIKAITIGRSPEADVVVLDERASRLHCGIRLWDGDFYLKDLQSKNGTFLNDEKVEMSKVKPGDKIRIGGTTLVLEDEELSGPGTVINKVEEEMSQGKGYDTILREIVDDVEPPEELTAPATLIQEGPKLTLDAESENEEAPENKSGGTNDSDPAIKPKRPAQIKIKRPPK